LLIQKYLVILAVDECSQQFYFPVLRVMKNGLEVELMFDGLKWHKDSQIGGGKERRRCRPILIGKRRFLIKCK